METYLLVFAKVLLEFGQLLSGGDLSGNSEEMTKLHTQSAQWMGKVFRSKTIHLSSRLWCWLVKVIQE